MEMGHPPFLINIVVVVAVISILITYGNYRWGSPLIAILNRWLRWIVFAFAFALITRELGWSDRPFWILAAIAFLGWFLGETMFNWIAINALSQSPVPLFPKFTDNSHVQEWPVQKRFIGLREWLRARGFSQVQSLKSDLGFGIVIRSFVFQSSDNRVRVQVVFVPQRSGNITECFSFHSATRDGIRLVTDNLYIPYGGFYPDNWRVVRKAWVRGMEHLNRLHERRLQEAGTALVEWDESPLEDLNYQQNLLERINTELGFLYPYHMREEYGKMTSEGRYRVWKEIWLLNYFGKSASG